MNDDRQLLHAGAADGDPHAPIAPSTVAGCEPRPAAGSPENGKLRTQQPHQQEQMPQQRQPKSASDIFSMLLHR